MGIMGSVHMFWALLEISYNKCLFSYPYFKQNLDNTDIPA